jgi:hypothetical protein
MTDFKSCFRGRVRDVGLFPVKTPLSVFLLLAAAVISPAEVADFVLLESPQSFTLYNEFEQPITASEKAGFLPFSPMQIIRHDARLGDQITQAMQCTYRQKTYYLIKDEQGAVIGDKGRLQLLKGCTLAGDTMEIMKNGASAFFEKSPLSPSSRTTLSKGTRLIVLFRYKNSHYSLQTTPVERFGWVMAGPRDAWKRVKQTAPPDAAVTEDLCARLSERVKAANARYKVFFDRFNASTGRQKSVPEWSEIKNGMECSWSLSEPFGHTGELDASTAYLVEDLRDILIGKPFSVRYENGRIALSPKAGTP